MSIRVKFKRNKLRGDYYKFNLQLFVSDIVIHVDNANRKFFTFAVKILNLGIDITIKLDD